MGVLVDHRLTVQRCNVRPSIVIRSISGYIHRELERADPKIESVDKIRFYPVGKSWQRVIV